MKNYSNIENAVARVNAIVYCARIDNVNSELNSRINETIVNRFRNNMRKKDYSSQEKKYLTVKVEPTEEKQISVDMARLYAVLAIPCHNREQVMRVCGLNEQLLAVWIKNTAIRAVGSALKYVNMFAGKTANTDKKAASGRQGEYIYSVYHGLARSAHNHDYEKDEKAAAKAETAAKAAARAVETAVSVETIHFDNMATVKGGKVQYKRVKRVYHATAEQRKKILSAVAKQTSMHAKQLKNAHVWCCNDSDDIITAAIIAGYEWIDGNHTDKKGKAATMYRYMYLTARAAIRKNAIDGGKYCAFPSFPDNVKDNGIDNYIDFIAYDNMLLCNTAPTADEYLSYIDIWIEKYFPNSIAVWNELKENGGKTAHCSSRQAARTLLKHIKIAAAQGEIQGI